LALHWAIDTELTGPTKVDGCAKSPKNSIWNVHGFYNVELTCPGDIRWDAKAEQFVNDAEANGMFSRPERPGHGVGSLSRA
jgi:hypothetical protein